MLQGKSFKTIYFTKPQKRVYLISPRWYIGIFSRGTGKTTRIQALRSLQTAMAVPGGLSVFYNATYVGAQQRTVANTLSGWKEMGWQEGIHYVKNNAPPANFAKNQDYEPLTWKNTISTYNGHVFVIGSNDRPGLVNSLSVTGGVFIDECRFLDEELMREDLYPAIRGNNKWGDNNPFVFSRTYTSDMPFISDEANWILAFEKQMNPEQIYLIAQASLKVEQVKNEIIKLQKEFESTNDYNIKSDILSKSDNLHKTLSKKQLMLDKIRTSYKGKNGSIYFDTGSFLSNIKVLTKDYFFDNVDIKKPLLAKTSFLNIPPEEVENKFYAHLHKKHFINGSFNYSLIEDLGISDNAGKYNINSTHIQDCDSNRELDIEFDFGDMCSCTVSQTFGLEERYIVTFDVILPNDIDDLCMLVHTFFKHHRNKRINVYKDASGSWMKNRKGQTYGLQVVEQLRKLGWFVIDRSPEGSVNPTHEAKYQLINMLLKEKYINFPIVRIIRETNRQLELSLKKAPRIVTKNKYGEVVIVKDKSSEREVALEDKPFGTTDHSDHFDYKLWHKYNHLLPGGNIFM